MLGVFVELEWALRIVCACIELRFAGGLKTLRDAFIKGGRRDKLSQGQEKECFNDKVCFDMHFVYNILQVYIKFNFLIVSFFSKFENLNLDWYIENLDERWFMRVKMYLRWKMIHYSLIFLLWGIINSMIIICF